MEYVVRTAQPSDIANIEQLIQDSVWGLSQDDYSAEQIELALQNALGVDSQLVADSTYFVVENGDELIGCGGWSFRKTLFGNDQEAARDPQMLNPKTDAAKIRAFFVKPTYARKGIGSLLMKTCEHAARVKGFECLELMSTLPGQKLYERHGFVAGESVDYPLSETLFIRFVPMSKKIHML